ECPGGGRSRSARRVALGGGMAVARRGGQGPARGVARRRRHGERVAHRPLGFRARLARTASDPRQNGNRMALKAAPEDQALLLELQDLDTRAQRLDHQLRNLPETARLAELDTEAQALRRTVAEQTGALEDAQAELGRVESDVAVVEARMARDRERLQATSSVKDVQALEQELEALTRRRDEL